MKRLRVQHLATSIEALMPPLLFGEGFSGPALLLMAAALLGLGVLLHRGGGGNERTLGVVLLIFGGLMMVGVVGLMALAIAGWGRPY